MSFYDLLIIFHLLLFVYWLGGDMGVFYSSGMVIDPKLSNSARVTAAKIMIDLDFVPRICMTLTLTVGGLRSYLLSPRADYTDFELRAQVKISDGGNAGLLLRARPDGENPSGYEAEINSSFPHPEKTGSLIGRAPVRVHLIPPDTWFDYHVTCRDEADGVRLTARVNGIVVNDYLDRDRSHASGHVGIEHHHQGSVLELRDIQIRELD